MIKLPCSAKKELVLDAAGAIIAQVFGDNPADDHKVAMALAGGVNKTADLERKVKALRDHIAVLAGYAQHAKVCQLEAGGRYCTCHLDQVIETQRGLLA